MWLFRLTSAKMVLNALFLDLALARKLRWLISAEILEEYAGVLPRSKFGIAEEKVAASLQLIAQVARKIHPRSSVSAAKDPDDNKFLECSAEAKADYLVTGNKRHYPSVWGNTLVVNSREFLQQVLPHVKG
jgi:putative PIN family toxin of toxin-antitoxin system